MSPARSFARARVTSIELTTGLESGPALVAPVPMPRRVHIIVRLHGHPIGVFDAPLTADADLVEMTRAHAWTQLYPSIAEHLSADGLAMPDDQIGLAALGSKCVRQLDAAPAGAPMITVALATLGDVDASLRTVKRLLESTYPSFEIVVVDNTPGASNFEIEMRTHVDDRRVRYAHETRKGLSFARNRGIAEARGDVVVFTDDDVLTDPGWLFAIGRGFASDPAIGCVTGSIIASEIETPAQLWLEQYGGYNKGFRVELFDLKENRRKTPLYPFDAGQFGSGANIAVRADVLAEMGGFATALGAGTPAHGGEDIDMLRRIVSGGHRLMYDPAALLWHGHRRSYQALRKQMYRYGVGFSATVTKWLMDDPRTFLSLMRRIPAGVNHFFNPTSKKNEKKTAYYPSQLTWLERAGLVAGPFLYIRSRAVARSRK